MTTISQNEEISTYQNIDIEGLEAKSWEILNENTALELKTQSGKALHSSVNKDECCAQTVTRMQHMLTPKIYEHVANPQTNVKFVGKSVDNVRKYTDKMHNKFRKSCTICEEALTISMNNHIWRVHGTQIHPCEACQCHYSWAHTNFHVGMTKTDNLKKRSKKKKCCGQEDQETSGKC